MTYYQVPKRSDIKIGSKVKVAEKANYATGEMTEGVVKEILTSKPNHPRGIKVRLTTGIVGRVQALGDQELKPVVEEEVPNSSDQPVINYTPNEDELI
jgi:uncharacterized repeat protein (TIGR03833 family)